MEPDDGELDPRIQIELENLNRATDEINKLEIELDEANTTFRMLLNESTRRLKLLSKKLGSCIEKARPYYDALEVAKQAQLECQKAAVAFQRANEFHAAAKETVALAEQQFMSNQHEWQFDNAWQEMLNHATMKVMNAEHQKAENGREHQKRATLFHTAEQKVQQLEDRLRRHIIKSRHYFDEKTLCQEQLTTQKARIETLKAEITRAKTSYSQSLKTLEQISNEIHMKRKGFAECEFPRGPREPGVGAELVESKRSEVPECQRERHASISLPDFNLELDRCEVRSMGSYSGTTSSAVSEKDDTETLDDQDQQHFHDDEYNHETMDELKLKVKELAIRPIDGGEGQSTDNVWESELKNTVDKLDHMMMLKECEQDLNKLKNETKNRSMPIKNDISTASATGNSAK